MPSYTAVSLTEPARDLLRATTLDLVTPLGRRLTMSEVLIAALQVAVRHRNELLAVLREETPGQG